MKLCRFELISDPTTIRSGMVYGGKVYETDGTEAIGIHEVADVRPLCPVPTPASVRLFSPSGDDLAMTYVNPASVTGPGPVIYAPEVAESFEIRSYLAATSVSGGYRATAEACEAMILGYSLLSVVVATDLEARERANGAVSRSHDLGISLGPVLTTPDELDDALVAAGDRMSYRLGASAKLNGEEILRGSLEELPFSMIDAVQFATQTSTIRPGDLFAIGPIFPVGSVTLTPGDEYQFSIDRLGALSSKLSRQPD